MTVQFARGPRQRDSNFNGGPPERNVPRPRRTIHRMQINGLPSETSWQVSNLLFCICDFVLFQVTRVHLTLTAHLTPEGNVTLSRASTGRHCGNGVQINTAHGLQHPLIFTFIDSQYAPIGSQGFRSTVSVRCRLLRNRT